jgi:hypothetical protein
VSELTGIARFKIHEGKLDEFKRLSARAMEIVRTKDTERCNTTPTSVAAAEVVYVGMSGGAIVATPDFGGETCDDSEPLTGSENALGVDFSVFPHLEREDMPDTPSPTSKHGPPGYRCRRTRSTMTPQ